MAGYLAVVAVTLLATFLFLFGYRKFAWRYSILAETNERMIHKEPIPTAGGIAILFGTLCGLATAFFIPQFDPVFEGSSMPLGLVIGAIVITMTGFVDDVRDVSPPAKVAGQVLAGVAMAHFGVTMFYFRIPFVGSFLLSPDLAAFLTVIWIVVIANAVNLIDGLDGLAAGIVAIASLAFFFYGVQRFNSGLLDGPSNLGPLTAIITAAACIGFLPHNFSPAKVFMGDSGSLLLGLLLATSAIILSGQTDDTFSGRAFFFFAPVFIPFVILGVPLFDTALAIVRRTRRRMSISAPDREHLHHRLMTLGHGPRRSVVILWLWTAVLAVAVLIPTFTKHGDSIVPFAILASGLGLYTYFSPGRKNGSSGENDDEDIEIRTFSDSEDRMSSPV